MTRPSGGIGDLDRHGQSGAAGGATAPDLWSRHGDVYDAAFTQANFGVAEETLRRSGLEPGMRVLDIGAGGGALSIPAARMGAEVLATDLSARMLELLAARARAEGVRTIRTAVMDGSALDLEADSFDRVCSAFGVMFFAERGLPEMRRVLAPGGRAIVVIWGYPDCVPLTLYRVAIERALGSEALGPENPFIAEPGRLSSAMRAAGFSSVDIGTRTDGLPATSGEDVWRWMSSASPLYASFIADLPAEQRAEVRRALLDAVEERYGDAFTELPMEMIYAIASE